jgi:hypothetical protein
MSLAATLRYVKAGVALAIAAFLVWQLAFTTPRLFDGLVQVASFAALLCATLYGVLQGALPDQSGEEARSATLIQARIRGQKERRQSRFRPKSGEATNSSKELASAVPPQAAASGPRDLHGKAAIGAAVGAAAAAWLVATMTPRIFSWVAYPVIATVLVCGSIYSWLRLPFWLGCLASELITRLAMHGYPLRMRSLRLRPWIELRPLKLHLDLFVTGAPAASNRHCPLPSPGPAKPNVVCAQPLTLLCPPRCRLLPGQPARLRCSALRVCG